MLSIKVNQECLRGIPGGITIPESRYASFFYILIELSVNFGETSFICARKPCFLFQDKLYMYQVRDLMFYKYDAGLESMGQSPILP